MTPSFDPPRIASGRAGAPDALCDALKSAASDGPSPQQVAQLSGALAPIFAASPSGFPAPNGFSEAAGAGAKVAGMGTAKGTTMLALAILCAAGGYGAWRSLHPAHVPPQNIAPATVTQPSLPPAVQAPQAIPVEQLPRDTEPVEGVTTYAKPKEPSRPRAIELPGSSLGDTPPAIEPPKTELSEMALVDLARRTVATDPRKALALAQDHHRRFAGGPLSEEADFIEIEAMKHLGRFEEARALDDRFRKKYPASMHGQTVHVRPTPSP